ncbi:MAG: oxygenase MpaB family protein [Actinomycetota bacterium]
MAEVRHDERTVAPPEPFGPGSLLWESIGDRRILLVLGGALIMQTMHPSIGHAVAARSVYKTDPWGRLERSLDSLQKWVYAGEGSFAEGERLRAMHKAFRGVDDQGTTYSALDPEPWAWVHLTAYERGITFERYFTLPGQRADERALYQEVLQLGRILQVPEHALPPTVEDYWAYFDEMVASKLEAHPTAVDVLERMTRTPRPKWFPAAMEAIWKPFGLSAGTFQRFITVGTFPPAIRKMFDLEWTEDDERKLRRVGRAIAEVMPRLPERLRYLPLAYKARKAARAS